MKIETCTKSKDKKHYWIYPRLEDSIDGARTYEALIYCTQCYVSKGSIEKNHYFLEKLKTDLYSCYEERIDWNLFSEEELLYLLFNWKFYDKVHDTLIHKIISLDKLSKESLHLIFSNDEFRQITYAQILNLGRFAYNEIEKYFTEDISRPVSSKNAYFISWSIEFTLKKFGEEIQEETRLELEKKKLAANSMKHRQGHSNGSSEGRH